MLFSARSATAAVLLALAALPLASQAQAAEQVAVRNRFARIGGLWCGAGLLTGFTLEIAQQLDAVQGKLIRKGRVREITGRVEGALVKTDPQRDHTMELLAQDNVLRIIDGTGKLALAKGQFFTRAIGGSCTS